MIQRKSLYGFPMRWFLILSAGLVFLFISACGTGSDVREVATIGPPPETRVETVSEEIFGHTVEDPYRWLEDGESQEVAEWVDAQVQYTRSALDDLPIQKQIEERLETLFSIGYLASPRMYGGRYFYTSREGEQDQPVLYVRDG